MGESSKDDKSAEQAISNISNIDSELSKRIQALQATSSSSARDIEEAKSRTYAFWKTQPVPQFEEDAPIQENTYIEAPIDVDRIRKQPYSLPNDQFSWSDVNLNDDDELTELYKLLSENYVEDDESMFRFDYSKNFLKWALMPPGWRKEWHCGLRVTKTKKLLAFIGAIPCKIQVRDKSIVMVEINFLCVHKQLRSKRVTPVLVKEITRRVNTVGIFQAAFTAGVVLPKPITTSRYWHRSLNPKKLIECGFSSLSRNMTLQRTIKLYSLPKETIHPLVPLDMIHIESAFELVTKYLSKFQFYPKFSLEEFSHYFLPQDKVVYTYVILNEDKVTDLVSFYSLPSTVVNHSTHSRIDAAYSYYNVASSISLPKLLKDALILAQNAGFDVFNSLDLMDNKKEILEELKFGIGDGNLQYYLYNWKTPEMKPEEVGLVLQ